MSRFPEIWAGRRCFATWWINFLQIVKPVLRQLELLIGPEVMPNVWSGTRPPMPDDRFKTRDVTTMAESLAKLLGWSENQVIADMMIDRSRNLWRFSEAPRSEK